MLFRSFKNKFFSRLLQGSPVLLVHNGKPITTNLNRERISIKELEQAAREHGVESISDVNLAVLEVDGSISILSENYQKKTKRKHRLQKGLAKMG